MGSDFLRQEVQIQKLFLVGEAQKLQCLEKEICNAKSIKNRFDFYQCSFLYELYAVCGSGTEHG